MKSHLFSPSLLKPFSGVCLSRDISSHALSYITSSYLITPLELSKQATCPLLLIIHLEPQLSSSVAIQWLSGRARRTWLRCMYEETGVHIPALGENAVRSVTDCDL